MSNSRDQALQKVNTFVTEHINQRLQADPTADLSELLAQLNHSYQTLRNTLLEAAQSQVKEEHDRSTKPQDDIRKALRLHGDVDIIYPLQEEVMLLIHSLHQEHSAPLQFGRFEERDTNCLNYAIANGHILWQLGQAAVIDLGQSVVVKTGQCIDTTHIMTLQFIKSHLPELPAVDILGALKTDRRNYIFMSKAEGKTLEEVWPELNPLQKASIQQQLNKILRQLRSISFSEQTETLLGSGFPARCKDLRRTERVAVKPIKTEKEFNDFLCSESRRTDTPWIKMIRSFMRDDHRIVLTHGDLTPRNIMVSWDGFDELQESSQVISADIAIRVTAIIDWETSGWYPEYWEFVKALSAIGPKVKLLDWYDYLPTDAIGTWPNEFSLDTLIDRWLG